MFSLPYACGGLSGPLEGLVLMLRTSFVRTLFNLARPQNFPFLEQGFGCLTFDSGDDLAALLAEGGLFPPTNATVQSPGHDIEVPGAPRASRRPTHGIDLDHTAAPGEESVFGSELDGLEFFSS